MQLGKMQKIRHFLGPVDTSLEPLFLNSMPKAGTNLIEKFLVLAGYRREFARCLNEHNVGKGQLSRHEGRFHIGHLYDDSIIHSDDCVSIYVRRDLWDCIKSYVNYMFIDPAHPASAFIQNGIAAKMGTEYIERLVFSDQNPLGRPVLGEYQRFFSIDESRYDLVIDFQEFIDISPRIATGFSRILGTDCATTKALVETALQSPTWTKNAGAIDVFKFLDQTDVEYLHSRTKAADDKAEPKS